MGPGGQSLYFDVCWEVAFHGLPWVHLLALLADILVAVLLRCTDDCLDWPGPNTSFFPMLDCSRKAVARCHSWPSATSRSGAGQPVVAEPPVCGEVAAVVIVVFVAAVAAAAVEGRAGVVVAGVDPDDGIDVEALVVAEEAEVEAEHTAAELAVEHTEDFVAVEAPDLGLKIFPSMMAAAAVGGVVAVAR